MKFSDSMLERAFDLAEVAHKGQVRKYANERYLNHCVRVAENLMPVRGVTREMLAAAILHDTVEDTDVTIMEILSIFGSEVASYVWGLTKISKPSDGNRAARKAIDHAWFQMQSAEVQTIKVADVIDNVTGIVALDPDFAKTYVPECRDLVASLHAADPLLRHVAYLALKREHDALQALVCEQPVKSVCADYT